MNPTDSLNLTAYALGELAPADAARMRKLIAESPEAREEYAGIQQTVSDLRSQAVIPKRTLHPHQREAILAAGRPSAPKPRLVSLPSSQVRKPNPFWSAMKLAAAACITLGAFVLGQRSASRTDVETDVASTEKGLHGAPANQTVTSSNPTEISAKPTLQKKEIVTKTVAVSNPPAAPAPVSTPPVALKPLEQPATVVAKVAPPAPSPAPTPQPAMEVAAVKAAPAPPAAAPAQPAHPPTFSAAPVSLSAFNNVSSQPEASFYFNPKQVRSVKQVFADKQIMFSAPLTELVTKPTAPTAPQPSADPKHKSDQPPLVIHSWRGEIASCPWDTSRRLLRVIAQIPVDQPAVESNDNEYRFVTKFDSFQVQGYRLIAEKQIAPSNGGTLATRFAWYEIIPTRNFSPSIDKPVTIGTLEIARHKHGAGAAEPAPLKLVDQGMKWHEAREDFVFETSMVGFSMLLQGTSNIGNLNHRLVLDLAEKAKGDDPERAKFIHTVQQAQRAAGL